MKIAQNRTRGRGTSVIKDKELTGRMHTLPALTSEHGGDQHLTGKTCVATMRHSVYLLNMQKCIIGNNLQSTAYSGIHKDQLILSVVLIKP